MIDIWRSGRGTDHIRLLAGIGMLSYLGSFFFLSSGAQKTLFYIVVAIPGLLLVRDLRYLLQQGKNTAVVSFLLVVSYFALSSLWSDNGDLLRGVKVAACLVCLLLVTNATVRLRPDSATLIRQFILVVGTIAVGFYCIAVAGKIVSSGHFAVVLTQRHSLRTIGGIGDSNPINGAIYLGVVILAAWWAFPNSRPLGKLGLLVLMASGTGLMFLTQSRGPFLSLIVTLFAVALARRHRDDFMLWGFALVAGVASAFYLNLVPTIVERANAPNYRLGIWFQAIELIKENLYFGQGLGQSADIPVAGDSLEFVVSHSHSSILETFRVGGIAGGLGFLLMLFFNARIQPTTNDERRFFLFWLFFGILCLSTNGRLPFLRPSVEWFALWIPLFLASLTHASRHDSSK